LIGSFPVLKAAMNLLTPRSRLAGLAVTVLAVGATAAPALATTDEPNLVADPGFEAPADGPGVTYYPSGTLGPWTVSGDGGIDHVGSNAWQSSEGDLSVDLDGFGRGAVTQNVPTTDGEVYQLHFALAGNIGSGPTVKTAQISWGGTKPFSFTKSFDTTGASNTALGWKCPSYPVKAGGSSIPLTFASLDDSASGAIVDDVRVVPAGLVQVVGPDRPTIGQGARKFNLIVRGRNFEPGYQVTLSNPDLTVGPTHYDTSVKLEVPVTVPADEPTGQGFDVTVTGGIVGESDTCGKSLSIAPAPAPTSSSPSGEAQGSHVPLVAVHGSNFQPGSVVAFGGGITVASQSFNSSTGDIDATINISPTARVGSRTITVRNPDGDVGYCDGCFTVQPN
jgi:choice-of-anchor C domain-containing protein